MKKVLETFLLSLSVSIENVLNTPEISEKLKEFNITKEILLGTQTIQKELVVLLSKQQSQTSEKIDTTKTNNELFTEAFNVYHKFVKLARITFAKDDLVISTLGLNGERIKTKSGLILQGDIFYTNCLNNENILNGLKKFGQTKEKLEAGQNKLNELKKIENNPLQQKNIKIPSFSLCEKNGGVILPKAKSGWVFLHFGFLNFKTAEKNTFRHEKTLKRCVLTHLFQNKSISTEINSVEKKN